MAQSVAMLGLNNPHSGMYLELLDEIEEIRHVPVYDPDPALLQGIASQFPKVSGTYTNLDSLLEQSGATHAISGIPPDTSAEALAKSIRSGVSVLTEKPGARNASEFEAVMSALKESNAELSVAYLLREHPAIKQMRQIVRGQALGRIMSVELRMITTQVHLRDPTHWLFSRERSGGGILPWLGCHLLDIVRFVTGEEFERVTAQLEATNETDIDVEDTAAVTFTLSGGGIGSLHAGYLFASGAPGYRGTSYDRGIHVRGTEGHLSYSFDGPLVVESVAPGWDTATHRAYHFDLAEGRGYGGPMGRDFLWSFLRASPGQPPVAGALDALRMLEVLDAIYEAADTGRNTEVAHRGG